MAGTLLHLFMGLSIATNLFNNALAPDSQENNPVDSNCSKTDCNESEEATFMIVFGDSLFDVGFGINELCLPSVHPPYGQKLKSPTGRFSDGRTIPDFIAGYVLKDPKTLVTPYTCGLPKTSNKQESFSFAQAGAGVLEWIGEGTGKTLERQVKLFTDLEDQFFGGTSQRKNENVLYLISIGAFDYLREIRKETQESINPTDVVSKIVDAVRNIKNKGGRRFAFMNLGPLRYYPAVQKLELGEDNLRVLDNWVTKHNEELKEQLRKALKDLPYSYSILDYHSIIEKMMQNPCSHGFDTQTIKSACCGLGPLKAEGCGNLDKEGCGEHSIKKYVFFDGIHHTEHINHHLAENFWKSNELASPQNLKSIAGKLVKTEFPGF